MKVYEAIIYGAALGIGIIMVTHWFGSGGGGGGGDEPSGSGGGPGATYHGDIEEIEVE